MWWVLLLVAVSADVAPPITGVAPGTYGTQSAVPIVTSNSQGFLTSVTTVPPNPMIVCPGMGANFAHVTLNSAITTTAGTCVLWNTVLSDAGSMYSTGTGLMTIPATGSYFISYAYRSTSTLAIPAVWVNGVTPYAASSMYLGLMTNQVVLFLNAGDHVCVNITNSSAVSVASATQHYTFQVFRWT